MKNLLRIAVGIAALSATMPALADGLSTIGPQVVNLMDAAMVATTTKISQAILGPAQKLLAILMLIQFTITNLKNLASLNSDALWAKFVGSMLWFSFCMYTMSNGESFLNNGVDYFTNLATGIAGVKLDAGNVFGSGLYVANELQVAFNQLSGGDQAPTGVVSGVVATGQKVWDFMSHPATSFLSTLMLFFCWIVIVIASAVIALKIFMLKVEAGIVIAMSPFAFSLLGLDALRDQGIAPFKYLISVVYRLLILSAVVAGIGTVYAITLDAFKGVTLASDVAAVWSPIIAALYGFMVLGYLSFRSDVIAGALSNGSSNFGGGGDAGMVGAALGGAAGVVAGSAVATAANVAGAASGNASGGMGNFMQKLQAAAFGGGSQSGGGNNGTSPLGFDSGNGSAGSSASASSAPPSLPRDGKDAPAPMTGQPSASDAAPSTFADTSEPSASGGTTGSGLTAGIDGGESRPSDEGNKWLETAHQLKDTGNRRLGSAHSHLLQGDTGQVGVSINARGQD